MEMENKKRKSMAGVISFNVAIISAFVIAYMNYFFDGKFDPGFLFFIPVTFTAIFAGQLAGFTAAIVSLALWIASDIIAGSVTGSNPLVPIINALLRTGSLALIVILGGMVRLAGKRRKESEALDSFTGLLTRDGFTRIGESELFRTQRYRRPLSAAYLDISNLREVNENMGYGMGDLLIQSVARIIKKNVRTSDVVCRASGDEFIILFPETDDGASIAIDKIVKKLIQIAEKDKMPVSFSTGLVTYYEIPDSLEAVIKQAQKLMDEAKSEGKNIIKRLSLGDKH